MKLFPYSLIRIGGESFEDWDQLDTQELNDFFIQLSDKHADRVRQKDALCNALMDFIMKAEDGAVQNAVQNVRRDIFNDRKVKNSKLQKALELLPADLQEQLNGYLAFRESLKNSAVEGKAIYDKVLHGNRETFKTLIEKDSIKKGLVLSSRSLLERLESYHKREISQFRKKEMQTEISLLQYLTRMYAKTSPFSTFTNLAVVENNDGTESISLLHEPEEDEVKGHIRLNNFLLKYLVDLFINYKPLYQRLSVRNNPTIQKEAEAYLYLTNNNNIEAFQRIPQNPVVEYIYDLVSADKVGLPFGELVKQLLEAIEAEPEEIEDYIKQLIDYGFLEYNIPVSGIDPDWDEPLIAVLEPMADIPYIRELIDTLKMMRKLSVTYADKPSYERGAVLQEAFDAFKKVCFQLHEAAELPEDERKSREELIAIQKEKDEQRKKEEEAKKAEEGEKEEEKAAENTDEKAGEEEEKKEEVFKKSSSTYFSFKPEQIFYEDTTRQIDGKLGTDQADHVIGQVFDLLQQLRVFQQTSGERTSMKKYFVEKYGEDQSVDLLTFYEDYFREYKKPQKEKERKEKEDREKAKEEGKTPDKPEEKPVDNRDPKIIKWEERFVEQLSIDGGEVVTVTLDALKKINEELEIETSSDVPASYGSFIQLMENKGKVSAFVNATFSGYGKMLSRFLHILGDRVTDAMRETNKGLILENELYIENCDASYFNANLHPTLMPNEIWMPGGHNSLPAEQQMPILDFKVAYEPAEDRLKLMHIPTGKRSYVFDLGFQGHQGRSQLFQLLDKFTKADYLFFHPMLALINQEYAKFLMQNSAPETEEKKEEADKPKIPKVVFQPRVEAGDLVLQRKTWMIPSELLPMKETTDDAYSFYEKVDLWRRKENLPDEMFVYVDPYRGNNVDPKKGKRLTRDDYKPQYINFNQPLLVNLFEKLTQKTPHAMKLVEMLPSSEEMLKIDGKRYVTEFVMQWQNQ